MIRSELTEEQWKFKGNEELNKSSISVRGTLSLLSKHLNADDPRPVVPFGLADPSVYSSFRTSPSFVQPLVDAVNSGSFNSYPSSHGILPARTALAKYISKNLAYQLSPEQVFLTIGCSQAIEAIISVLSRPAANILLPRPSFPLYKSRADFQRLEVRHFDLIPEKGWEVDLEAIQALADHNTVAIVVINPNNPCGSVYTYHHLKQIAETARKLGVFVISDEVYAHMAFGEKPFVPMGEFGSIAPVLTLGSLSKRWSVPGWRLGWIVITDPHRTLEKHGIVESIRNYLNITPSPPTFIQAALPQILAQPSDEFFSDLLGLLRENANILYEKINEIPCFTCPNRPEGSMLAMVKLNLEQLEGVSDDLDFCNKVAKEESVLIIPGSAVGMKNWLRLSFGIERCSIEDGAARLKAFYERHARPNNPAASPTC
ncbi:tyrosine aminotransferase-like isoform X3 [Cucurbita maxima]|uniref:Tyrosine aminotransferase-like isoform X3 n=1 Tax=Cucurbita maxima TaxID=3661 RepID=A0A6J1I609_CUCMA|nr:tyrosine aminotransferase-like isoform X3 [Cucurbita maxima]